VTPGDDRMQEGIGTPGGIERQGGIRTLGGVGMQGGVCAGRLVVVFTVVAPPWLTAVFVFLLFFWWCMQLIVFALSSIQVDCCCF